jgi:hypothetical protein
MHKHIKAGVEKNIQTFDFSIICSISEVTRECNRHPSPAILLEYFCVEVCIGWTLAGGPKLCGITQNVYM